MKVPYQLDLTQQVVHPVTATDSTVAVPVTVPTNPLGSLGDVGSEWFICVDGNPVAVNVGGAAVFGTTGGIIEPGSYLTAPLYLPPGETLHVICASTKTATLSLIRARRTA